MGLSLRAYARHRAALGLPGATDAAVRKALRSERITAEPDGTIDPARADRDWSAQTDPSMQRGAAVEAQLAAMGRGRGLPLEVAESVRQAMAEAGQNPDPGGTRTLIRARLAREILTAQLLRERLRRERAAVVDRARAEALVLDLARASREAWSRWPALVAAGMAAELGADPHQVEAVLERHLGEQLAAMGAVAVMLR